MWSERLWIGGKTAGGEQVPKLTREGRDRRRRLRGQGTEEMRGPPVSRRSKAGLEG